MPFDALKIYAFRFSNQKNLFYWSHFVFYPFKKLVDIHVYSRIIHFSNIFTEHLLGFLGNSILICWNQMIILVMSQEYIRCSFKKSRKLTKAKPNLQTRTKIHSKYPKMSNISPTKSSSQKNKFEGTITAAKKIKIQFTKITSPS